MVSQQKAQPQRDSMASSARHSAQKRRGLVIKSPAAESRSRARCRAYSAVASFAVFRLTAFAAVYKPSSIPVQNVESVERGRAAECAVS